MLINISSGVGMYVRNADLANCQLVNLSRGSFLTLRQEVSDPQILRYSSNRFSYIYHQNLLLVKWFY